MDIPRTNDACAVLCGRDFQKVSQSPRHSTYCPAFNEKLIQGGKQEQLLERVFLEFGLHKFISVVTAQNIDAHHRAAHVPEEANKKVG